jgi:phosphoribosylglycinamide formyltransferase-1
MDTLNIAVFVSGHGTNLQAIIDNCANGTCHARVVTVISNNENSFALTRAAKANIPAHVINHKHFATREDFDRELLKICQGYDLDLICLAGFMRVLTPIFITPYDGRVINIHPSLLPKHKGLHTHKQVLKSGDVQHGCTVHIVTPELDDGPILVQRIIDVYPTDTEDTLNDRVLSEEIKAYTEAINIMAKRIRAAA